LKLYSENVSFDQALYETFFIKCFTRRSGDI
jgi:hypothetical protein